MKKVEEQRTSRTRTLHISSSESLTMSSQHSVISCLVVPRWLWPSLVALLPSKNSSSMSVTTSRPCLSGLLALIHAGGHGWDEVHWGQVKCIIGFQIMHSLGGGTGAGMDISLCQKYGMAQRHDHNGEPWQQHWWWWCSDAFKPVHYCSPLYRNVTKSKLYLMLPLQFLAILWNTIILSLCQRK